MSQSLTGKSVNVSKKRWAAYAAAGVAATITGTQSAEADITHVVVGSGAGDITVANGVYSGTLGTTGTLVAAVLNAGTSASVIGNAVVAVIGGSVAGYQVGAYPYASNVAFGANISTANFGIGTSTATMAYGNSGGQFLDTGGFVAFQFNGGTQFGWARFSLLNGTPVNEYVLEEYAYGMVGEAVTVGQTTSVPEPTSLGLLALGAVGVMANRRRKQNA